jgi:hypothetical protein
MVKPAICYEGQAHSFDSVLEVRRPNANCVYGHRNACPTAKWPGKKRCRTNEFKDSSSENNLRRERHPCGGDKQQFLRYREMSKTRSDIKRGNYPTHSGTEFTRHPYLTSRVADVRLPLTNDLLDTRTIARRFKLANSASDHPTRSKNPVGVLFLRSAPACPLGFGASFRKTDDH